MTSQRISTDLTSLDDNSLLNYATGLAQGLAGNKRYPDLKPAANDGLALIQRFGLAIGQSRTGGAGTAARKNQVRAEVEALLLAWIAEATAATAGDTVAWLEAGFKLTKETRDKAQPLPAPSSFTVDISGEAGTARLRQKAQPGSRAYVFGYALVPADGAEPVWTWQLCGKPDCLLMGLDSEKPYLFVAGVWNGAQPWPNLSAAVRRVVQ